MSKPKNIWSETAEVVQLFVHEVTYSKLDRELQIKMLSFNRDGKGKVLHLVKDGDYIRVQDMDGLASGINSRFTGKYYQTLAFPQGYVIRRRAICVCKNCQE